jgi:hypothetical protein
MERAGWRHPDDFPECLYHYTSGAAFMNILTSNELWFADFRYLNDLSEMRYGIDLFKAGTGGVILVAAWLVMALAARPAR